MYRGDIVFSRLSPTIMYVHGMEIEGERLLSGTRLDANLPHDGHVIYPRIACGRGR